MNKTILFYSPLQANMPSYKIGGAEAGCRRTVEILKKLGYRVELAPKPTNTDGIRGYVREALYSLKVVRKALRRPDVPLLYIAGFYEKNIYLEWLITKLAKRKKKIILYEPKNGCMVTDYEKGSAVYRFFNRQVLRAADLIFCQGRAYQQFLKEELSLDGVYIPNYVMDRYLTVPAPHKKEDRLHLVFSGRIVPEKNIGLMIEVSHMLSKKNIKNDLTLIGAYTEPYRKELNRLMAQLGMKQNQVRFLGNCSCDFLFEQLKSKDFFLFPSANRTEGHSNALTEAMAFGVIPVACTAGFNRDVIGNDDLIVPELRAEPYAERIAQIVRSGRMEALREEMIRRVKENFTESVVTARIKEEFELLHLYSDARPHENRCASPDRKAIERDHIET